MRKTRSDCKLLSLPEEAQAKLAEWLLSGMSYADAKMLIAKEPPEGFGVSVSFSSLTSFWESVCQPELLRRRSRAVQTAEEIAQEAQRTPGRFDAATIDALKQRAFELSIAPHAHPKDVKALFMLVLKAKDQEIDEAQLALDQAKYQRETCELFLKWSEDQRAREIAGSTQTNSEKIERLGELMFGEDWK